MIDFHPGWRHYEETVFTLVPGETKEVTVRAASRSRTQDFWAGMDPQRSAIRLCDNDPRSVSYADCAIVSGIWADFADGIERSISLKEIFNGVSLRCAYRPTNAAEYRRFSKWRRQENKKKHGRHRGRSRALECVIAGGNGAFERRWKPIQDIAFTLAPGEKRNFSMASRVDRDRATFWAELDQGGRKLEICGYKRFGEGSPKCGVIAGLSREFSRGLQKPLSVRRTFRDSTIRCAYAGRGH